MIDPVTNFSALRKRIGRLLVGDKKVVDPSQKKLHADGFDSSEVFFSPGGSVFDFLRFLSASFPQSEIYIFGGLIRDIALFGKKGFNSDLDLVVVGDWPYCASFLNSIGASRNKFGGFRLVVGNWPVDIWNAEETWAIKSGFVSWYGVRSLLETTVLNWDAILMCWRTGGFVCKEGYLRDLRHRYLDVILENNPHPLGMAVRVFRHLCMKDAQKISVKASVYLARATREFSYKTLVSKELDSYGETRIERSTYEFFSMIFEQGLERIPSSFSDAEELMREKLVHLPPRQYGLPFDIRHE